VEGLNVVVQCYSTVKLPRAGLGEKET